MAIARQYATTVATTATVIGGTQYPGWILKNNGANIVYIGDSAVTTTTGFPIAAGDIFSPSELSHRSLRGKEADRLYGIVAAATENVRVLIMGRLDP